MEEIPIHLRRAQEDDVPLIYDSWMKSFKSSRFAQTVDPNVYYPEQHSVISYLLARTQVVLAVSDEAEKQIYGYLCYDPSQGPLILHYCYVKQPYRGFGIATKLISTVLKQDQPFYYTHDTGEMRSLLEKGCFNPFLLMQRQHDEIGRTIK
jgi:GNAT superfamily N-acetyltransferase